MFGNIGASELIIIGIVLIVFFGANKLKEFARGLGESTREIKKIKHDVETGLFDDKGPSSS